MCGILASFGGYKYKDIPSALIERGRDSQGIYQDDYAQLIQTRLEITPCNIELPFKRNDKVLLFNGEVYNWKEFGGANEFESILIAFERYGDNLVEHLDGQFYIIIYDTNKKLHYHFHDPFNIHCVYHLRHEFSDVYSSNIRSLPKIKFNKLQHQGFGNITTAKFL